MIFTVFFLVILHANHSTIERNKQVIFYHKRCREHSRGPSSILTQPYYLFTFTCTRTCGYSYFRNSVSLTFWTGNRTIKLITLFHYTLALYLSINNESTFRSDNKQNRWWIKGNEHHKYGTEKKEITNYTGNHLYYCQSCFMHFDLDEDLRWQRYDA